jgi:hypothetical protein
VLLIDGRIAGREQETVALAQRDLEPLGQVEQQLAEHPMAPGAEAPALRNLTPPSRLKVAAA